MVRLSAKVSLCGAVCALALLIMLVPYLVPYTQVASPVFAGLLMAALVIELNRRWAVLAFVASALLAYLLAAKISALSFFLFFGYYPIAKSVFESLKSKWLGYTLKAVLFYAMAALSVWASVVLFGFTIPKVLSGILGVVLVVAMFPVFLLYDRALTGCIAWYISRLHRQVSRIFSR